MTLQGLSIQNTLVKVEEEFDTLLVKSSRWCDYQQVFEERLLARFSSSTYGRRIRDLEVRFS